MAARKTPSNRTTANKAVVREQASSKQISTTDPATASSELEPVRYGRDGRKLPAHLWRKGQSGNPGGRPKKDEWIILLAQQHTEKAINTLVSIMTNKKASPVSRVAAAKAILDRGYGKPPQTIVGDSERPLQLVTHDIEPGLSPDEAVRRYKAFIGVVRN